MSNEDKSEYWHDMVDILDHCFPKGENKERGQALVMLSLIELRITKGKKVLDKLINEIPCQN